MTMDRNRLGLMQQIAKLETAMQALEQNRSRAVAQVMALLVEFHGGQAVVPIATLQSVSIPDKLPLGLNTFVNEKTGFATLTVIDGRTQKPLMLSEPGTPAVLDGAGRLVNPDPASHSALPPNGKAEPAPEPEAQRCDECHRYLPFHNMDCSSYENLTVAAS